jgi:hypothetical protein
MCKFVKSGDTFIGDLDAFLKEKRDCKKKLRAARSRERRLKTKRRQSEDNMLEG